MAGVTFTKNAAERTKKAVLTVEREYSSTAGEQRKGKGAPFTGFWAKITSSTLNNKKYSWEKLEAKDNQTFASRTDWGTGDNTKDTGYAVEVNESKYVLKDSIVWLEPAFGQDYFVFQYNPGVRLAKTGGAAIAAVSGNTLGSATVSVWKVANGVRFDTNLDIKAFNTSESEIAEETFVHITYNTIDGIWYVTWEDC